MKKVFLTILCLISVLSFAGCSANNAKNNVEIVCETSVWSSCGSSYMSMSDFKALTTRKDVNVISINGFDCTRDSYYPHYHYCVVYEIR